MNNRARKLVITGIVQGVGFRPFIYTLAISLGIRGWVNNEGANVVIHAEQDAEHLKLFTQKIREEAPPLAVIRSVKCEEVPWKGYENFRIVESEQANLARAYISPDVSTCSDCEHELFDPRDRRYGYPFINCTHCGPRFTIIQGFPYDRRNTTMKKFPMCPVCAAEYHNPSDRRYHAQPVACHDCGPAVSLLDANGAVVAGEAVSTAVKLLQQGKILCIKGLGGYHLACDAANGRAVAELRRRKKRDAKPFALMASDMETVQKYCECNAQEESLLQSVKKPIVLLRKKKSAALPGEIAPGNQYLGIMLPYTPLHLLLFRPISPVEMSGEACRLLVMTSGNISSEPICYRDQEALERLKDIADYFLVHNREIYMRTDDSVTRIWDGGEYIQRRSRGYVPLPVSLQVADIGEELPSVLACGGELKNTFCLNKGEDFFLSHHIGDLENTETLISYQDGIGHFSSLMDISPQIIAYDLHPRYLSTQYAQEFPVAHKYAIQHHHAHIASCMAENGLQGEVIGIAFDGTGLGDDGHIWGGEFFTGSYTGFTRAGHLEYIPMPGGGKAIEEPWRMALSYLMRLEELYPLCCAADMEQLLLGDIPSQQRVFLRQAVKKKVNSPLTSSMGRLFDAVSALLGMVQVIRYEGEGAILLEQAVKEKSGKPYSFSIEKKNDIRVIQPLVMFCEMMGEMKTGADVAFIASRFHSTVAHMMLEMCRGIREDTGLKRVVMSGGVFQNITLLSMGKQLLAEDGFDVYTHSAVPANDGGIALGQAVMAMYKYKEG